MSDNDKAHRQKLPDLVTSPTNDYHAWSSKCQAFFENWGYWSHVGGDKIVPPVIPEKVEAVRINGIDDEGNPTSIIKPGNTAQYEAAVLQAEPWLRIDRKAKALIFAAVPSSHFHLVQRCTTANMAWESLRAAFLPANAERGANLRRKIQQYVCRPDMNVTNYLDNQLKFYVDLCRIDPTRFLDREFYETVVDLLPTDDRWVNRVASIRDRINKWTSDHNGIQPNSMQVINWIKDEDWHLNKDRSESDINAYSSRYEADRLNALKRSAPASEMTMPPTSKRSRVCNPGLKCDNVHCKGVGHTRDTCFAFGGGQCGKYPHWWGGPWNIHMPPNQRDKSNNVWPVKAPTVNLTETPIINNTLSSRISAPEDTRAYYPAGGSSDFTAQNVLVDFTCTPHFNEQLPAFVLNNHVPETVVCNAAALRNPISQDCIHDSAANRHVFHSRSSFSEYEEIDPVKVKGFGKELSTAAIGKGTVVVEARFRDRPVQFFDLQNCLHIPSARYNLISGSQLDHNGVQSTTANGQITLSKNGEPLVSGELTVQDMYKLEMRPVPRPNVLDDDLVQILQTFVLSDGNETLEGFTTASLAI